MPDLKFNERYHNMSRITRRNFIVGSSICMGCVPSVSFSKDYVDRDDQKRQLDKDFYFCSTPQISINSSSIQNFSSDGMGRSNVGIDPVLNDLGIIQPYATARKNLRWRIGDTDTYKDDKPVILIGFLDGTDSLKEYVMNVSKDWLENGVYFGFLDNPERANIRISFIDTKGSPGNHSAIGRDALNTKHGPTMCLPAVKQFGMGSTSRGVILHEFGHAVMTMGHEHRHPDANFHFKSPEVIARLINNTIGNKDWTAETVKANITNPPYSMDQYCTPYDRTSIMHYAIQSSWLVDGSSIPTPATKLSDYDLECAKAVNS